jgi:hypothetical protein
MKSKKILIYSIFLIISGFTCVTYAVQVTLNFQNNTANYYTKRAGFFGPIEIKPNGQIYSSTPTFKPPANGNFNYVSTYVNSENNLESEGSVISINVTPQDTIYGADCYKCTITQVGPNTYNITFP